MSKATVDAYITSLLNCPERSENAQAMVEDMLEKDVSNAFEALLHLFAYDDFFRNRPAVRGCIRALSNYKASNDFLPDPIVDSIWRFLAKKHNDQRTEDTQQVLELCDFLGSITSLSIILKIIRNYHDFALQHHPALRLAVARIASKLSLREPKSHNLTKEAFEQLLHIVGQMPKDSATTKALRSSVGHLGRVLRIRLPLMRQRWQKFVETLMEYRHQLGKLVWFPVSFGFVFTTISFFGHFFGQEPDAISTKVIKHIASLSAFALLVAVIMCIHRLFSRRTRRTRPN